MLLEVRVTSSRVFLSLIKMAFSRGALGTHKYSNVMASLEAYFCFGDDKGEEGFFSTQVLINILGVEEKVSGSPASVPPPPNMGFPPDWPGRGAKKESRSVVDNFFFEKISRPGLRNY